MMQNNNNSGKEKVFFFSSSVNNNQEMNERKKAPIYSFLCCSLDPSYILRILKQKQEGERTPAAAGVMVYGDGKADGIIHIF
jgi:hypothetical protein